MRVPAPAASRARRKMSSTPNSPRSMTTRRTRSPLKNQELGYEPDSEETGHRLAGSALFAASPLRPTSSALRRRGWGGLFLGLGYGEALLLRSPWRTTRRERCRHEGGISQA